MRSSRLPILAPVLTPGEVGERRSFLVAYPILQQTTADRRTANSEWAADLGEELRHKPRSNSAPAAETRPLKLGASTPSSPAAAR
jgi:hypothetical protein